MSNHQLLEFRNTSAYHKLKLLGSGYFGTVHLGVHLPSQKYVAIKTFLNGNRTSTADILMEAFILQSVCGGPHVIKLIDVIDTPDTTRRPALVFEYINATPGSSDDLLMSLSPMEVKYYLRQLLEALVFIHSVDVVHRDVQPANIMINKDTKQLTLIDFGVSFFYEPHAHRHFRGNLRYEPPCALIGYLHRDHKADMWSFGLVLASLLFRKMPFLSGSIDFAIIMELIGYLGADDLQVYMESIHINDDVLLDIVKTSTQRNRTDFRRLVTTPDQQAHASGEAIDLVDKLLRWNPRDRLTAKEALSHPYFSSAN
eukprot:gene27697-33454_t